MKKHVYSKESNNRVAANNRAQVKFRKIYDRVGS